MVRQVLYTMDRQFQGQFSSFAESVGSLNARTGVLCARVAFSGIHAVLQRAYDAHLGTVENTPQAEST